MLTLLLGISLVMALSACGGGSSSGGTDSTQKTTSSDDANQIFQQHCASCHGGDLKGVVGPNLTKVGSKFSKAQILDIIKNGKSGGMPQGLISGDEADKVAAWLAAKK
ncbi:cytochrome c [Bacillus sp. BRMEA1]|nr:cytochrome c [Neobacillus endophyticus]